MSDRIRLQGVDVYAHHGVHPAERELGQRFVIDADLNFDCSAAGEADSLEAALDYSAVHARIRELAASHTFHLLEAVAHHLCRGLLEEFPIERIVLTVHKPHPPLPDFQGTVSVTMDRDRAWLSSLPRRS